MGQSKTHMALSMSTSVVVGPDGGDLGEGDCDFEISAEEVPRCSRCLHTSRDMKWMIDWFQYDQIGAACVPRCVSCRCQTCPPGGKQMTLKDEREMATMESCLTFMPDGDAHIPTAHWDASYAFLTPPETLPNNLSGVMGTYLSNEKRLNRNPAWKAVYLEQMGDLRVRGVSVKLTKKEMHDHVGPIGYISHLIAPNPNSKTSPCRVVWNSSQPFKNTSLNSCLMKGPDFINPMENVLLRVREKEFATFGDVTKMYNSVWLKYRECHLHCYLLRNEETGEIEHFMIVRVNIGDRPAGCLSLLAVKMTAELPEFEDIPQAAETVKESTFVDNILDSVDTVEEREQLKKDVDRILTRGAFRTKPWADSGQKAEPTKSSVYVLPNQIADDESRALGLFQACPEDAARGRSQGG